MEIQKQAKQPDLSNVVRLAASMGLSVDTVMLLASSMANSIEKDIIDMYFVNSTEH